MKSANCLIRGFPMSGVLLVLFLSYLPNRYVHAQCTTYHWPEDSMVREKADKNLRLLDTYIRDSAYESAMQPLSWLLYNTPKIHESFYINGAKLYNALLHTVREDKMQSAYYDSLMQLYDFQMINCGGVDSITVIKAYLSYKYTIKDKRNLAKNLRLFDQAFTCNGNDIPDFMLLPYYNIIAYCNKMNLLNYQEYFDRVDKIMAIAEDHSEEGDSVNILNRILSVLDPREPQVDCDFIHIKLAPQYWKDTTNSNLGKRIFGYLLTQNCPKDSLYLSTANHIMTDPPSHHVLLLLAKNVMQQNDPDIALEFGQKALTYANTREDSIETYFLIGRAHSLKKERNKSRDAYLKILDLDPENFQVYEGIGYLYYSSYEDCKRDNDIIKNRAVFIAAYEMFMKAGNVPLALKTREQFPSNKDYFHAQEGDKIHIGCWIDKEVILQFRD